MADIKVALVQSNPIIGDLQENTQHLLSALTEAASQGADLAITPELALCGYPPRDLLLDQSFIKAQRNAITELARNAPLPCLVGFVSGHTAPNGHKLPYNAVAWIENGRVQDEIYKSLLPCYDIFDEPRYFSPASSRRLVNILGIPVGVSVCEDIWNDANFWTSPRYELDPIQELADFGAKVLINLSASPFARTKRRTRQAMLCAQAQKHCLPLLVVNQVGAHDDVIFDGGSLAIDKSGEVRARCHEFQSDVLVIDLNPETGSVNGPRRPHHSFDESGENEATLDALVLGVRQYADTCGMGSVVLGLSGGVDSALTAAVAARALGPKNVHTVALPSQYSSAHSVSDAQHLAEALGTNHSILSIEATVDAISSTMQRHLGTEVTGLTEENIQARARGLLLMALSNTHGHLLLNTGNKTEIAVGYCTLYGDMCGGLSVLSDLYKRDVYALCRVVNQRAKRMVIPESTLTKAPSAELRPGQKDTDTLPPYTVLDELVRRIVENQEPVATLRSDFDPKVVDQVVKMIHRAEFKRAQLPPGLKVTQKAFGPGRRMPIACRQIAARGQG